MNTVFDGPRKEKYGKGLWKSGCEQGLTVVTPRRLVDRLDKQFKNKAIQFGFGNEIENLCKKFSPALKHQIPPQN